MSESEGEESFPLEETLLLCARRGQAAIIRDLLKSRKEGKIEVDINCKGGFFMRKPVFAAGHLPLS